ncbi:MAG: Spy/CpxP family protein refolding chaperone [Candidatus Omnitrophica bacterium]|nr:Spy/CpxP family protein refolding chaperone [Candidatus Omnitrophota bacterium]
MNKKCLTAIVLVALFACFTVTQTAHAYGKHSGYSGKKGHGCSMSEGKFNCTLSKVLNKKKELVLNPEQISQIKKLSSEVKKNLITRDAKIKTLKVEIDTLMWEFPFSSEGVNELVAQMYSLKTEKTQYVISAYSRLEAILTEDQIQKLKDL